MTSKFKTMTLRDLIDIIERDSVDLDKPVRIWVENRNQDDVLYLEGRRLIGLNNDPNYDYVSLVAGLFGETDLEEKE